MAQKMPKSPTEKMPNAKWASKRPVVYGFIRY